MNRLDTMRDRLPPVWGSEPETLTHGLLALVANLLAALDEDLDRVQRSHWVDTAFDMQDLARIGALVEVVPAPWEGEALYRARLKAIVAARLAGAVTRTAMEGVLVQILAGAQESLGVRYFPLPTGAGRTAAVFANTSVAGSGEPAFDEFPVRRQRPEEILGDGGRLRPLSVFDVQNLGLFPTNLFVVIRGAPGLRTAVPLIANLTNGQVLVFRGTVACGSELRLGAAPDGKLEATLDGVDVAARFVTGTGFVAGERFAPIPPDPEPMPLVLEPGLNTLWFYPLALYGEHGLGSGVLGMPDREAHHGRWEGRYGDGEARFGDALFEQEPFAGVDLWWNETTPASFRFEIPSGVVRREAGRRPDPELDRERLFGLLQDAVSLLRAAGVDGRVTARPFRSEQRQTDRCRPGPAIRAGDEQRLEGGLAGLEAIFDFSAESGARYG